ncbi:DUF2752 domain-containing protein [Crocosphaera sp.]|uniref:DUF2752 domain-containing protein n=1 Tax=Crocosphaera sp. TaxID=2729996 RepID=UPI002607402D|nr:DUF2752 domain-containing protein [Crocosphaera sp.]MDJ0582530.1 DUF2752 domain-containing protein [Crocosphaera sp.]
MTSKKTKNYRCLSAKERRGKVIQLLVLFIPILVSYLSSLGIKIPLPGCPLLYYLGVPCPGWGLTRSFKAIVQINLSKAIEFNLFGPIFFIIFLTLTYHLIKEIISNKELSNPYIKIIKNPNYQTFFLLIVLGYHGTRLQSLWERGELSQPFLNSPVIQWILTGNWSLLVGN